MKTRMMITAAFAAAALSVSAFTAEAPKTKPAKPAGEAPSKVYATVEIAGSEDLGNDAALDGVGGVLQRRCADQALLGTEAEGVAGLVELADVHGGRADEDIRPDAEG